MWTRIRPAALSRTASRNSSPTRTSDGGDVALVDRGDASTAFFVFSSTTRSSSRSRRPICGQQPVGEVARRADRPASLRPVRQQPAPELERGRQLSALAPARHQARTRARARRPGKPGQAIERASASFREATAERHGFPYPTPTRPAPPRSGRGPALRKTLARPLRRLAARGSPGRGASHVPNPAGRSWIRPAPHRGLIWRSAPRARTTEPADSPAIRTSRTTHSLATDPHRRLNQGVHRGSSVIRRPGPARPPWTPQMERLATSATTKEDPIKRGVQTERRPDRPAPEEDPAQRQRDRDPRPEPDDGQPERVAGRRTSVGDDMGEGEHQGGLHEPTARPQTADPGCRGERLGTGSPRRTARR